MADERQGSSHDARNDPRGERKEKRRFLTRKKRGGRKPNDEAKSSGPATAAPAPKAAPKATPKAASEDPALQERRERRRRRRVRSRRSRGEDPGRDSSKDLRVTGKGAANDLLDMGDVTLKPVFIYTYTIRPSVRETFESRSEHFSKVTRKLEDFNIDLSPLFAERTDTSPPGALAPLKPLSDYPDLDDEAYDEGYDEEYAGQDDEGYGGGFGAARRRTAEDNDFDDLEGFDDLRADFAGEREHPADEFDEMERLNEEVDELDDKLDEE